MYGILKPFVGVYTPKNIIYISLSVAWSNSFVHERTHKRMSMALEQPSILRLMLYGSYEGRKVSTESVPSRKATLLLTGDFVAIRDTGTRDSVIRNLDKVEQEDILLKLKHELLVHGEAAAKMCAEHPPGPISDDTIKKYHMCFLATVVMVDWTYRPWAWLLGCPDLPGWLVSDVVKRLLHDSNPSTAFLFSNPLCVARFLAHSTPHRSRETAETLLRLGGPLPAQVIIQEYPETLSPDLYLGAVGRFPQLAYDVIERRRLIPTVRIAAKWLNWMQRVTAKSQLLPIVIKTAELLMKWMREVGTNDEVVSKYTSDPPETGCIIGALLARGIRNEPVPWAASVVALHPFGILPTTKEFIEAVKNGAYEYARLIPHLAPTGTVLGCFVKSLFIENAPNRRCILEFLPEFGDVSLQLTPGEYIPGSCEDVIAVVKAYCKNLHTDGASEDLVVLLKHGYISLQVLHKAMSLKELKQHLAVPFIELLREKRRALSVASSSSPPPPAAAATTIIDFLSLVHIDLFETICASWRNNI